MKVLDAELLTAKKPAEMVTDGLIMWIDGRDAPLIRPGSQKIYERVTGTYLNGFLPGLNLSQSSDGLFLEFLFNSEARSTSYPFYAASSLTFEAVISPETLYGYTSGYANNDIMYISRNAKDPPYIRATYKKYGSTTNTYFYPSSFPQHLVYRPHSIVCNGEKEVVQETIETRIDSAVWIVSWSTHLTKIGAIRAYNRELTDDEVRQNLEYEKSIGRVVL